MIDGTLKLPRTNCKFNTKQPTRTILETLAVGYKLIDTNVFGDAEGADGVVGESLAVEILDRHRLVRHALTDDVRPVELALFLTDATSQLDNH